MVNNHFFIVCISHSDYLTCVGGTEKYIMDEQKLFQERQISYLQLSPTKKSRTNIWDKQVNQRLVVNIDGVRAGILDFKVAKSLLYALTHCVSHTLVSFHLHHLLNWSAMSVDILLKETECSRRKFFIHDYYTVCQQHNLMKNAEYFCGGGPAETCLEKYDCSYAKFRPKHYRTFSMFLATGHFEFIVPSESAATVWLKSYPEYATSIRVVPHLVVRDTPVEHTEPREEWSKKIKIAYIGYPAYHKGLALWEQIIEDDALRRHYEFYIFGLWAKVPSNIRYVPVNFSIDGSCGMERALIRHNVDMAFLWSICSETFSYTFHEAFAAGCFVLTSSFSGNIQAQVHARKCGMVFDDPSQLWSFLRDIKTVRSTLKRFSDFRKRKCLSPNPEIAEETALLCARHNSMAGVASNCPSRRSSLATMNPLNSSQE
jgi:hypothetical protein